MTTAAALLVLRLLPLLARVIDPLARRGSGFVLPVGGWQVGRRAARHAGAPPRNCAPWASAPGPSRP
ncbi:hypothetical protein [Streptomyces sp. NPDC048527]|uniref:hypothetical protein n=1 Tax=Streptomyces sp. NPDC048527 TaxID=3365568 RepID=UPI00371BA6B6